MMKMVMTRGKIVNQKIMKKYMLIYWNNQKTLENTIMSKEYCYKGALAPLNFFFYFQLSYEIFQLEYDILY